MLLLLGKHSSFCFSPLSLFIIMIISRECGIKIMNFFQEKNYYKLYIVVLLCCCYFAFTHSEQKLSPRRRRHGIYSYWAYKFLRKILHVELILMKWNNYNGERESIIYINIIIRIKKLLLKSILYCKFREYFTIIIINYFWKKLCFSQLIKDSSKRFVPSSPHPPHHHHFLLFIYLNKKTYMFT